MIQIQGILTCIRNPGFRDTHTSDTGIMDTWVKYTSVGGYRYQGYGFQLIQIRCSDTGIRKTSTRDSLVRVIQVCTVNRKSTTANLFIYVRQSYPHTKRPMGKTSYETKHPTGKNVLFYAMPCHTRPTTTQLCYSFVRTTVVCILK